MKRNLIIILLAAAITSLSACGNKNDAALPVDAEPTAEVTKKDDTKDSEPVEVEEPETEPAKEEDEPEKEEAKPLDLDTLDNLKWAMDGLVNLFYHNYNDFCSGKEDAIIELLWYMDYCSLDYPNLPKGEGFSIDGDGYTRFTVGQAQEAVNSLTGRQVDISSVGENGVIEMSSVGVIDTHTVCKNWNTKYIGNKTWKVYVDKYRYGYDYDQNTLYKEAEITFTVTENADSIFDGYSIVEVEEAAPKMSEWAKAYYDYLSENIRDVGYGNDCKCYLIYLDNNDIPELYVDPGLDDKYLLYYSDDQVKEAYVSMYSSIQYISQSGLYMEKWDALSYPSALGIAVYQLINGEYVEIVHAVAVMKDEYADEYEGESWMYNYMFNGEAVSEEEYNRKLNESFDTSKAIELTYDEGETLYSMLNQLSSQ